MTRSVLLSRRSARARTIRRRRFRRRRFLSMLHFSAPRVRFGAVPSTRNKSTPSLFLFGKMSSSSSVGSGARRVVATSPPSRAARLLLPVFPSSSSRKDDRRAFRKSTFSKDGVHARRRFNFRHPFLNRIESNRSIPLFFLLRGGISKINNARTKHRDDDDDDDESLFECPPHNSNSKGYIGNYG